MFFRSDSPLKNRVVYCGEGVVDLGQRQRREGGRPGSQRERERETERERERDRDRDRETDR